MKSLLTFILFTTYALSTVAAEYTAEDSELFDRAYKYNQEGKHKEAFEIYTALAEKGHADAENNLGYMYKSGIGTPRNYEKAFELYYRSAIQDYVHAQVNLAYMYDNGFGTKRDLAKAIYWLKRASDHDFALAQFNLGIHYYKGDGVNMNIKTAMHYFQKSCVNGHTEGCFAYRKLNEQHKANKTLK